MDTPSPKTEALAALLETDPGRFEPTTAYRVAEQAADGGLDVRAHAGVSVAPLAVSGFRRREGKASVQSGLAVVTGPVGSMPPFYNELVMREERNRSRALAAFFDLFSARISELFAAAGEKYRMARRLRWSRGRDGNAFLTSLFALTGFGTARLKERSGFDDDLILRFSGFFAARTRNAANLQAMLAEFTGLPIEIDQFRGRWLPIPLEERSQMQPGNGLQLGVNASAGAFTRNFSGSFRVVIGPVDYPDYLALTPGSRSLAEIFSLTRLYVGTGLDFDIQIILKKEQIPQCRLGDRDEPARLGWNSWARIAPAARDSGDAVIPEPRPVSGSGRMVGDAA
ncbi:type VI secretion system baseplate subunit TssG [Sinorhizobium americanum]|uniref:Type VI secretion system protein ImpH n=1 Tax=Sinorhizobium americanum TaxID=194963 RepID=A0A4V6NKZ6_9HYPH|nr:type VI secretion system baseplate subunit TssG [Sinorhizobium americanum]TCN33810.1 type VI secretion system protein ImpH [Sinorhizobium americanum]